MVAELLPAPCKPRSSRQQLVACEHPRAGGREGLTEPAGFNGPCLGISSQQSLSLSLIRSKTQDNLRPPTSDLRQQA